MGIGIHERASEAEMRSSSVVKTDLELCTNVVLMSKFISTVLCSTQCPIHFIK